MTREEAQRRALSLMAAILDVPGAKRTIYLAGDDATAFLESLGAKRFSYFFPATETEPAHVIEGASVYAAHRFCFLVNDVRPATDEEIASNRESVYGLAMFDRDLGAELVSQ